MKCRTLNRVHSNVDDSVQVIKTICKSVDKKQQWHEFATGAQHWDLRQSWILDFHAVDSGFQVLDSNFCQWNLGSGFQSLVGFRIPWAVFRGAIHSTKIPTGNGPVFRDFSGWIEPIHRVLDLNFRQFWFKWIAPPDSSCKMFRDSGFHEQQFHGFLNPVIPLIGTRSCVNKPYAIPKHSNEN